MGMAERVKLSRRRLEPREIMMWLYLATMGMLFMGFSSAYLVQRFAVGWSAAPMPFVGWINTIFLLVSSYTWEWGRRGFILGDYRRLQVGLMLTMVLGVLFLMGQVIGWQLLVRQGFFLASNQKGVSYFYVLTFLHAIHLVAGLIMVGYWMVRALLYRVQSEEAPRLRIAGLFWHALDALWVYLFVFLQLNQLL
jgi:cytochrome c oxidase subunit 3